MIKLSNLKVSQGVKKTRKRVGRGIGSGTGKTCGKGQKGQKSRSGGNPHPWFEGGQMPLYRRLPKRGFTNIFKKEFQIVNLNALAKISGDAPITADILEKNGLIKKKGPVKILGKGDLSGAVTVHANKFSKSAVEKIEKSGGKAVQV